jgi:hypothetical protein
LSDGRELRAFSSQPSALSYQLSANLGFSRNADLIIEVKKMLAAPIKKLTAES